MEKDGEREWRTGAAEIAAIGEQRPKPDPPPRPATEDPQAFPELRSSRWILWSLLPMGLGTWVPLAAGVRVRRERWTYLGALLLGAGILAWVFLVIPEWHLQGVAGLLFLATWPAGAISGLVIRVPYARTAGPAAASWPEPTERSRSWSVQYALAAYIVTFVGANGLGLLLRYGFGLSVQVGIGVLIVDGWLLAAFIPIHRRLGLSRQDIGIRETWAVPSVGLVIGGFLAYGVVAAVWVAIVQPHSASQTLAAAHRPSTFDIVSAAVAISVCAPVVEEIFFRGLLYRALRNRMGIIPAALIAGCLFGLVHITSYPLDTLPVKAGFGVIACLLYERTGSLLPGIALHSIVDAGIVDTALTGNPLIVIASYGGLAVVLIIYAAVIKPLRRPPAARTDASPEADGEPLVS